MRVMMVVALLAVTALPAAAQIGPGGTFIDDDGSNHEPAIEAILHAGITTGCDPVGDRFCPSAPVTRAEMAAFLVRAMGGTELLGGEPSFPDVNQSRWYFGWVERLAESGVSLGYADGTFRPEVAVTRGEMAVFLIRALGESAADPPTGVFADVPIDAFYAGSAERLAQLEVTRGCATTPLRFCPNGAVSRAEMASFLARAFGLSEEPVPPRPSLDGVQLSRTAVAGGLDQPVFVTAPTGDNRLFVLEKEGRIRIVENGSVLPGAFLDISSSVSSNGERGLLGMAFHPDYSSNGRFFVHYTDGDGSNRVVEYAVSADPDVADTDSARVLLTVPQPASNHNGGMIEFGPDARLYVAIGDGGGANDQFGHGQDSTTRLGAITAIDVESGSASLFSYGLRNPWRFAWDGQRVYIGDVGQNAREEIDVLSTFDVGANLGWSVMEGSACFDPGCSAAGLVLPVAEYTHDLGCSVTGGYVYRGSAIPELVGHYLYGDFCSGSVWSFRYTGVASEERSWPGLSTDGLVSFGVDGIGEMYLVSIGGTVWRIESN